MGTDHYGVEVIFKGTISLWIQACCFWGSIHYDMNLFKFLKRGTYLYEFQLIL
jgi:hypothetical protein